ncbi:MAG: tetratricopeptide repeat protein [Anaerolineales bacterium]|nr:tetratricopeptide repeat protein [Anaerolineales bacterium]
MADRLVQPLDQFKERELEIIGLMAAGLSNREIADQLFITTETVRWYNKQIYSKLGTSRRTEAIAQARALGLLNTADSGPAGQPTPHRLPATTGPFIGRDDDMAALAELIARPDVRLLSIVALGGTGKSRLALEFGRLRQSQLAHGAVFVDLTATADVDGIATVTLKSLGLSPGVKRQPKLQLFDYCRDKELLLIFDNFEHLLPGAALLTELLAEAPLVKILTTSRESLNLRAETTYFLQPVSEHGELLFREVAAMMHPQLALKLEEQAEIERIVEAVGGLPLALLLAASWLDTLTLPEIAAEIVDNLAFLSAEMGDMPARQQSIYAVIDPTWKRLSDAEQTVFMWTAVFRGGFTRQALQQITGASPRIVQTLLRRSLLSQGQGRRYNLHPLIQQYAREKLAASPMESEARQAHLTTYLTYVREHTEQMFGEHYVASLEALLAEQDNVLAALDWSLAGAAPPAGIQLVRQMSRFWLARSQIKEAVHYLELASQHRPDDPWLWVGLSFCYHRLGEPEKAEQGALRAITLAQETDAQAELANGYRLLALQMQMREPTQETRQRFERALSIARQSGNLRVLVACLASFAIFLADSDGERTAILELQREALRLSEEIGDLQSMSQCQYNLAVAHFLQGDSIRARELCEASLRLKRQIGDSAGMARRLTGLAQWDIEAEEFERAGRQLSEARLICEDLGEKGRLRYVLLMEGLLFMITGEFDRAQTDLEQARDLAISLNESRRSEECHSSLAMLFLIQGQYEAAWPHVQRALQTVEIAGYTPWVSLVAFANYLWYRAGPSACLPLVATLSLSLDNKALSTDIATNYFLRPLLYRVMEKVGPDDWQEALAAAEDITLTQRFQEIMKEID